MDNAVGCDPDVLGRRLYQGALGAIPIGYHARQNEPVPLSEPTSVAALGVLPAENDGELSHRGAGRCVSTSMGGRRVGNNRGRGSTPDWTGHPCSACLLCG